MGNQKLILCLFTIEAVVNNCTQSIIDDLENGCESADEKLSPLFEISQKTRLLNRLKKEYYNVGTKLNAYRK